jgi:protein ImuB
MEQIALRLTLASFAAEEVLLRLTLSEGSKYECPFKIPAPTANPDVLFRVLYTHLENLRTEHPIKALYLRALPCRPTSEQFNLFDCTLRDPNHFYETLGRLTALLGQDRVGIPAIDPTYRPDAFRMAPLDFAGGPSRTHKTDFALPVSPRERGKSPSSLRYGSDSSSTSNDCGLSLRRFRPPLPAHVELQGKHPCALRSTLFQGPIRRAAGPWRSSGQWWDKQFWHRDEWDVQTANGRLYRLYRECENWFVEGVYD